jgi:SAM-dependent methyltransferase
MISEAKKRSSNVDWRIGSAEETHLESNSIDGLIGFLTIHHWSSLKKGFLELNRILENDGRIVLFTSTTEQMDGYWLNHYFPKMLEDSKKQMSPFSIVNDTLIKSGFKIIGTEKYFVRPDLKDHFLYCGKYKPGLYLKQEIRNGITSFSDIARRKEIETGLMQLKKDVRSGKILNIISKFENDNGDYIFIIAKKHGSAKVISSKASKK